MFTNKAVRVLGCVGIASVLSMLPACDPSGTEEAVNVNVQDPNVAIKGGSPFGPAGPLPPAGYQVKWSTCFHYLDGDAGLRNNSRIVEVANDGTVPIQRVDPVDRARGLQQDEPRFTGR